MSFTALSFWSLLGSCVNRTTHIGARRLTTASVVAAVLRAVLPVTTHPPHEKPTIIVTTATPAPSFKCS